MYVLGPKQWSAAKELHEKSPDEGDHEDIFRALLSIVLKWLPQMAVVMALCITSGIVYLSLIRGDIYVATAKLYVRIGVDQAPSPLVGSDRSVTYLAQAHGAVQSEVDMLRNEVLIRRLVEAVDLTPKSAELATVSQTLKSELRELVASARELVDQGLAILNLKTILSDQEAMRLTLAQSVLVESAANSDVISVALRWSDKDTAESLLQRFLDLYISFRSSAFETGHELAFLDERLSEAKSKLDVIDADMVALEKANDIRNAPNRAQLLEGELIEAQRLQAKAALDLDLARDRLARLELQPDALKFSSFPADSPASMISASIISLLTERDRLLTLNTPEAQPIRELNARLDSHLALLQRQLEAEVEDRARIWNSAHDRFESIIATIRNLHEAMMTWKSLERRREAAELRYRDAEKRLSDARDVDAVRRSRLSNVVLVQPAQASALPIGIRKISLLTVIVVVSLIMACGWAVVRELLDGRLHQARQAARLLRLPLLGELPETKQHELLPVSQDFRDDTGRFELALERASAVIDRCLLERDSHTLSIVGARRSEGVSTFSLSLSAKLSEQGRRVLFVEADGKKPCLLASLRERGLVDETVKGKFEGVPIPDMVSVSLTNGMTCLCWEKPAEREARSALFDAIFSDTPRMPGVHDLIVLDLPPLDESAEAAVVAGRSGATLYVAAAARQSCAEHQRALRELRLHKAEVIGLIFTRVRNVIFRPFVKREHVQSRAVSHGLG